MRKVKKWSKGKHCDKETQQTLNFKWPAKKKLYWSSYWRKPLNLRQHKYWRKLVSFIDKAINVVQLLLQWDGEAYCFC